MSFINSDDDFHDLRRQEEYERQKNANMARGLWNFLYKYIIYSMVWIFSSILFSMLLSFFFDLNSLLSTILGMIGGLFLFKVQYTKTHPVKSLITIGFMFWILSVAFNPPS